jgi:hypothetical protein
MPPNARLQPNQREGLDSSYLHWSRRQREWLVVNAERETILSSYHTNFAGSIDRYKPNQGTSLRRSSSPSHLYRGSSTQRVHGLVFQDQNDTWRNRICCRLQDPLYRKTPSPANAMMASDSSQRAILMFSRACKLSRDPSLHRRYPLRQW